MESRYKVICNKCRYNDHICIKHDGIEIRLLMVSPRDSAQVSDLIREAYEYGFRDGREHEKRMASEQREHDRMYAKRACRPLGDE